MLRLNPGDALPSAIADALRSTGTGAAWIRATGVVSDVELRTLRGDGSAMERRFSGPMQLVSLEGAVGARSELGLSAVLARETERGLETVAGTLVRARVILLEALAIGIESRANGGAAVDLGTPAVAVAAAPPTATAAPMTAAIPQRPVRPPPPSDQPDAPFPDAGDVVEHFAFGTCDVLKTDGDRIHLRVHKDQRIKEIAPEMLRVVPLDLESTPRRFRLERKI
jgi:predicted DNA-binding protein with PD1-like motif